MHFKTRNRLIFLVVFICSITFGITLILANFSDNISLFVTPSQLLEKKIKNEVRLGGYAKSGTIKKIDINNIEFDITDRVNEIHVTYKGPIPLIFRDGQGVIVKGKYQSGIFVAKELLAKHDEKYKPKNIPQKSK